jgi:hypothetical protein
MTTKEFRNNQDTYSIDDLRERFNKLADMRDEIDEWATEYGEEFAMLQTIIDEADRYNVETLISEYNWEYYCQDMVEDCYDMREIPDFVKNCIDWEGVAAAMAQDYSTIDVDGVTYYWQ